MSSAATIYGVPVRTPERLTALTFFAKAFALVGREIGFTPGRTVALAASLLALENDYVIEVDSMLEAVGDAAQGDFGEHLLFSGGSRLDREFLIRVKPELDDVLAGSSAAPAAS
jgi:hypothetical protein